MPKLSTQLALGGLIALGQGGLLTSMLWATALALAVQRKFVQSAAWLGAAAILAGFGMIHAYTLTEAGPVSRLGWLVAPEFALSYAAGALFLLGCHVWSSQATPHR